MGLYVMTCARCSVLAIALGVLALPVLAADGGREVEVFNAYAVFKVLGSLLLVLFVIFASAWYIKRAQGVSLAGSRHVQLLSSLAVGAREQVVLIQVGKEQLLLGVAPGSVTMLKALDEPVDTAVNGIEPSSFKQYLHNIVKGPSSQ